MRNLASYFLAFAICSSALAAPAVKTTKTAASGEYPAQFQHEVIVNIGDYGLNDYSDATLRFGGGTALSFGAAYNYTLLPYLQLGGRLGLSHYSLSGSSLTLFSIAAGPTINFPFNEKIENAFFGSVLVGLRTLSATGGLGTTAATFTFEAGKRFQLLPNLSWHPTLSLLIPTSGDVIFSARLLQASVHF